MNRVAEQILMHYGMPRRSGRYPWGSGDSPYQHSGDFASRVKQLRADGVADTDIAKLVGLNSTTELRAMYSVAVNERRATEVAKVRSMKSDGYSNAEIAKQLGKNESTIRSLLNDKSETRMNQAMRTADFLREQVESKGMIDVGTGVERELGVSREKLSQALEILRAEGYEVYGGGVPQVTNPGKQTNIKVVCPPGTEHKDIYDFENVHSVVDYKARTDEDGNDIYEKGFVYPKSLDSDRVQIRYAEEGGLQKDGVMEIRRNVPDLDLGASHYAQVRILVDDNRYLKGMALYSDNMPDGVDIVFNTNKKLGTPKEDVLKKIKDDPDNPFGALLKEQGGQYYYTDENGERQLGCINKTRVEGDWGEWSKSLPSQFLAKQSMQLINKQLGLELADRNAEFEEICSLNNPTVKKELLQSFADECDYTAVHLQAAALPNQKYQVILPIATMKDTEVYAPNYHDGETVALIRYPHGGTFEIPVLKVNNKQPDAQRILGNTPADAIGINSKVAERLSGADFDGDTVMVIPCNSNRSRVRITSTPELRGLKGFDAKLDYGADKTAVDTNGNEHYFRNGKEFRRMNNTQTEMGKISNLITDMTLKGATTDELACAVRHSMVVIDAEKHKLDYRQSEEDNMIASLKKRYQERYDEDGTRHEGASTLISRAKGETQVLKRKGSPIVDRETGKVSYKEVREEYTDKNGKVKLRTQKSTQMAETDDARTLISDMDTPMERAYADYANSMKALANEARKEYYKAGKIKYSAAAKDAYLNEVNYLNRAAERRPEERAQGKTGTARGQQRRKSEEAGTSRYDAQRTQEGRTAGA